MISKQFQRWRINNSIVFARILEWFHNNGTQPLDFWISVWIMLKPHAEFSAIIKDW